MDNSIYLIRFCDGDDSDRHDVIVYACATLDQAIADIDHLNRQIAGVIARAPEGMDIGLHGDGSLARYVFERVPTRDDPAFDRLVSNIHTASSEAMA